MKDQMSISYGPMGEMTKVYNVLVSIPERKTVFGTPTCRFEGSIIMKLKEILRECMDWID
jgi:hypothetical protein